MVGGARGRCKHDVDPVFVERSTRVWVSEEDSTPIGSAASVIQLGRLIRLFMVQFMVRAKTALCRLPLPMTHPTPLHDGMSRVGSGLGESVTWWRGQGLTRGYRHVIGGVGDGPQTFSFQSCYLTPNVPSDGWRLQAEVPL